MEIENDCTVQPLPEDTCMEITRIGGMLMKVSAGMMVVAIILIFVATKVSAGPIQQTTITGNEFIADLRAILNDTDSFWGDDEFLKWMNSGRRSLASVGAVYQRWITINVVPNTVNHDLPDDAIQIMYAFFIDAANTWVGLKRANPLTIGQSLAEAQLRSEPSFFIELPNEIGIIPTVPSVTTENLYLLITYMPAELANTEAELGIPEVCYDALKAYVLHYAFAKDKQNARSAQYRQIYNTEMSALRQIYVGQPLGNEEIITE